MSQVEPKRDLVGIWSADHMYGPGAMSDEIAVFKGDGTGRLDIINITLCTAYEFVWECHTADRITIRGTRTHQLTRSGVEIGDSELLLENQQYRIAVEDTKAGVEMPVLRIQFMHGISDHFGFVRSNIYGFEVPIFN